MKSQTKLEFYYLQSIRQTKIRHCLELRLVTSTKLNNNNYYCTEKNSKKDRTKRDRSKLKQASLSENLRASEMP